jgi:hypothetical protein
MRRKDRSALSMPAAVQRSTICPSRQRVTLRLVVRAIEITDSTELEVVSVLVSRSSMPKPGDGEHLLQALAQASGGAGVCFGQHTSQRLGVGQPLVGVGVAEGLDQLGVHPRLVLLKFHTDPDKRLRPGCSGIID